MGLISSLPLAVKVPQNHLCGAQGSQNLPRGARVEKKAAMAWRKAAVAWRKAAMAWLPGSRRWAAAPAGNCWVMMTWQGGWEEEAWGAELAAARVTAALWSRWNTQGLVRSSGVQFRKIDLGCCRRVGKGAVVNASSLALNHFVRLFLSASDVVLLCWRWPPCLLLRCRVSWKLLQLCQLLLDLYPQCCGYDRLKRSFLLSGWHCFTVVWSS